MSRLLLRRRGAILHIALQLADGVGDGGPDGFEVLDGGGGGAGKIQDEGALADSADGAREHGMRSLGEAGGTHGFAEAGDDTVEDLQRGFRCDVARREAGAAGGEDEIGCVGVCPVAQGVGNERLLVGHETGGCDFDATLHEPLQKRRAALVVALATGAFIADGKNGRSDRHMDILQSWANIVIQ